MKKCTSFEEQKSTIYIRGNICFGIIAFSCFSSTKLYLRIFLICSSREIKDFYQSSVGNEVNFMGIINVSPNILAKNKNFKKLRHGFVDKIAPITKTWMSSCHWKALALFCLREERPENAFLTNFFIGKVFPQMFPNA